jgi:NAD(P)-dependent dehydrogenase (short-subunit alcohol dehydrogenase family)
MKTAVITGVSYGIGKATTETLLDEGWKVYGVSRSKPAFESERFVWLQCDLSQHEHIAESLKAISEPHIDALISNAGVIYIEDASAVSKISYEKTFSVNVLAPMLIVNALLDKIRHSTIISISSVSDRIAEADVALYCSSKAANTLYFNALADELKEAKIFTLLPDYVDTPMLHGTMDGDKNFDWSATIKPEDIAKFSRDLISRSKALETGANVIIVTEKLKEDLKSVEKLYSFNTDTNELKRL